MQCVFVYVSPFFFFFFQYLPSSGLFDSKYSQTCSHSINASLILGEQDWDRASFQIGVSDLIQLITEGRLRHTSGPARYNSESVTLIGIFCKGQLQPGRICSSFVASEKFSGSNPSDQTCGLLSCCYIFRMKQQKPLLLRFQRDNCTNCPI